MDQGENPTDFLREADDPDSTARDRGYSHGELPGGPLHLTSEHWANLGPSTTAPAELDEERREAGISSDVRFDGDVPTKMPLPKAWNPNSGFTGWDKAAQAAYFVSQRHSGVWADQAWGRYLEQKKRTLPDPKPCTVCGEVFQPERVTALYCKPACSQKAKRVRQKARRGA